MKAKVAICSSKKVRGQILAKTLSICGIQIEIVEDIGTAVTRVENGEFRLVIIDVNSCFSEHVPFVREVAARFPEFILVIHNNPSDLPHLMEMGLREDQCLSGPLDPEAVFLKAEDLLKEITTRYGFFNFPKPKRFLAWRRRKRIAAAKNHRYKFSQAVFGKPPAGFRQKRYWTGIASGLRVAVKFFLIPLILFIGVAGGYLYWILSSLPDIDGLTSFSPYKSTKLYSYDNVLLTELYIQRRTPVRLIRVPEHVRKAFIAIEDARYFEHSGIDLIRIAGAIYADLRAGEYQQGGSTITQQLAKMIFLKPEKTIARKIREIGIALQLERKFTKDQILELYLNQAYFGSRAYGIQAAAEAYFGKEVDRLTLAEGAMLAALPKAPSVYSPFQNPQRCLMRRNYVLKRMIEIGAIDKIQYGMAEKEPLPGAFHGRVCKAPYFVDYCTQRLTERFGDQLFTGGLQIYSTLDFRMQQVAEEAVQKGIADLESRGIAKAQAALVAIELHTGRVRAVVGGTDYEKSEFNRATQALRQPGSAFKPIVYLTALLEGFSSSSVIQDKPITLTSDGNPKPWTPKNYSGNYRGEVTLKQGLALSLNAATIDLAIRVGIRDVLKTAKRLGIHSKIYPVYSSALGASEMTLIELVLAYSTLATGKRTEPECIERVIDKETMSLQEPAGETEIVIHQAALTEMRTMLKAVVEEGTARKAMSLNRTVYGKTGTTNENADALFIGFDDRLAVGVWVGRDDHEPLGKEETGARAALPIWIYFMEKVSRSASGDAEKDPVLQTGTTQSVEIYPGQGHAGSQS